MILLYCPGSIGRVAYNTRMPWNKRDAELWVKVDARGEVVTDRDGRIEVAYKPAGSAKGYRGLLEPVVDDAAKPDVKTVTPATTGGDAIHVWTDGACSGNPGPAGIGVVVIDGSEQKEISEYLGQGTNNIAELTAIQRGLEQVKDRKRPVVVYTDSEYAIGCISKPWKPKKNVELIADIRELAAKFSNLKFVKVAGHAGIELNEKVDELARNAITNR